MADSTTNTVGNSSRVAAALTRVPRYIYVITVLTAAYLGPVSA
jgi:hypothetical protein